MSLIYAAMGRQTSIIFGSRDIPEIVHACQKLSLSETKVNFVEAALHSDIFLLEKTFGIVLNQLNEWFGLN
ncbi:hypothetical protein [Desulfosporosinus acidiphilus]|uniref:hypothetical protein n=1 Tax=Desulfosporosinus acidiphilus TaxID=885581 RepID=UPI000257AFCE|nr:hypothetical protein [Desulfosporosinus acidiphilus]